MDSELRKALIEKGFERVKRGRRVKNQGLGARKVPPFPSARQKITP
jgi:hypothetical protein